MSFYKLSREEKITPTADRGRPLALALIRSPVPSFHPLVIGVLSSLLVVACSYLISPAWVTDTLALLFLGLGYYFVTRAWGAKRQSVSVPQEAREKAQLMEKRLNDAGLLFGGLLSSGPLQFKDLARRGLQAFTGATWIFLCIALPYSAAFWLYFEPGDHFSFAKAWCGPHAGLFPGGPSSAFLELILAHLFVIALPEELFFRGFLQPALIRRWGARPLLWGGSLGWANLSVSLLFALGHYLTSLDPQRLAVFFPSLLFGWLAQRRGSISSSVILHAQCNLLVIWLNQGWTSV